MLKKTYARVLVIFMSFVMMLTSFVYAIDMDDVLITSDISDVDISKYPKSEFVPVDTINEDVISKWAKPEIEKAIGLGFVPRSLRDKYKLCITRCEFAKLAMFFLQMQYGYPGVSAVQTLSMIETADINDFKKEFQNAYCASKKDRNGNPFKEKHREEEYEYRNNGARILLSDSPFSDVSDCMNGDYIRFAYHIGAVNGKSRDLFDPEGKITRQEAAAMLMRIYKNYSEVDVENNEFVYSDESNIADWAKKDVYDIKALGVMQGVEENMFDPLGEYTVEQAIASFWRLYDSAPVSRKNKNITPLLDYEFESKHYFDWAGGRYFHETDRLEYDNVIVVTGYWTGRSTWTYNNLVVFCKYGGVIYDGSNAIKCEVSEDENSVTLVHKIEEAFSLFNNLNGVNKLYEKGVYQAVYDVSSGMMVDFTRIE